MPDNPINYRRLPSRSFGFFQSSSLWAASDHLLLVNVVPIGETYRRFFFTDIQAIVIRRTPYRMWANVVLFILAALGLLPLLFLLSDDESVRGVAILACGSLIWLALALANTLRGPTCETRVQTAVQTMPVGALGRVRAAQRVVDLLRQRVLEAQNKVGASVPKNP